MAEEVKTEQTVEQAAKALSDAAAAKAKEVQEEYFDIEADGRRERVPRSEAIKRLNMGKAAQVRLEQATAQAQANAATAQEHAAAIKSHGILCKLLDQSLSPEAQQAAFIELMDLHGRKDALALAQQAIQGTTGNAGAAAGTPSVEQLLAAVAEDRRAIVEDRKAIAKAQAEIKSLGDDWDERFREKSMAQLCAIVDKDAELGKIGKRLGPRAIGDCKAMAWEKYVRDANETQQPGLAGMERAVAQVRAFYANIDTQGSPRGSTAGFGSEGSGSPLRVKAHSKLGKITDGDYQQSFRDVLRQKVMEARDSE